jgi:hypothetical protein
MDSRDRARPAPGRPSSYRLDALTEPPSAATVELVFHRRYPSGLALDVPRGTRVSTSEDRVNGRTFMTGRRVRIEPGQDEVRVLAYDAEFVDGELLGFTTGLRRTLSVARVPIVAATTADLELVVGVAADPADGDPGERALTFDGRTFVRWSEVGSIWSARTDGRLFIADRLAGEIALLPHARTSDGDAPSLSVARREIRAWYWRGGGTSGNVPANTLTVLQDSLRSLVVTNPAPARGGQNANVGHPAHNLAGDSTAAG